MWFKKLKTLNRATAKYKPKSLLASGGKQREWKKVIKMTRTRLMTRSIKHLSDSLTQNNMEVIFTNILNKFPLFQPVHALPTNKVTNFDASTPSRKNGINLCWNKVFQQTGHQLTTFNRYITQN